MFNAMKNYFIKVSKMFKIPTFIKESEHVAKKLL